MNKIYIIKNISPWMLSELSAFSEQVRFRIILLRKPRSEYFADLQFLESQGVEVFVRPFKSTPSIRKTLYAFKFLLNNLRVFWGLKNIVIGFKALYWFVILNDNVISNNSSLHAQFATQACIISLLYSHYLDNVEYSFTFHAHDIFFFNRWLRLLINESICCFSISNFNINYVRNKYYNTNYDKIILSRLGVLLPSYLETQQKNPIIKIGFLSWWGEKKGLLVLLQAVSKVINDHGIPIKVILAGDGPMRTKVQKFIKIHDIRASIEDRGKIFGNEKRDFYNEIDVFVLPSIKTKNDMDGIPVVLMEAISYGVPIISTDIAGIPEICSNNFNGFLVPSDDADLLSTAIVKFCKMDITQFSQFKCNAHLSREHYDIIRNSNFKLKQIGWINNK